MKCWISARKIACLCAIARGPQLNYSEESAVIIYEWPLPPSLTHLVATDDELHGVAEKEEDHDEDEGERRPRVSLLAHAQGLPESKEKENLALLSVPPWRQTLDQKFLCEGQTWYVQAWTMYCSIT